MNASLERRLSMGVGAFIVVAGIVATAFSFYLSQHEANELQDAQLQQIGELASGMPMPGDPPRYIPRDEEDAETHLVIKGAADTRLVADPTVNVTLPSGLTPGLHAVTDRGIQWRVLVSNHRTAPPFAVAQRMTVRDEIARDSAKRTLLPLLILIPVLLLLVRLIIHRSFKPLVALSKQVERAGESDASELDTAGVPTETLPLVQSTNRALKRLNAVLDTQRRLVADAAHELRSPVAALMLQAANVAKTDLPADARSRLSTMQAGLTRMASLLEQLLSLARVQGARPRQSTSVDLASVVRGVVEDQLVVAQLKSIDLGCVRLDSVRLRGDPMQVQALVRNGIDNAVRYSPIGGSVDISVYREGDEMHFIVQDNGPGLDDAELGRVFEPFYRVLGTQETGSGLGLAIALGAARALGGTLSLTRRPMDASGLIFHYRQPAN